MEIHEHAGAMLAILLENSVFHAGAFVAGLLGKLHSDEYNLIELVLKEGTYSRAWIIDVLLTRTGLSRRDFIRNFADRVMMDEEECVEYGEEAVFFTLAEDELVDWHDVLHFIRRTTELDDTIDVHLVVNAFE